MIRGAKIQFRFVGAHYGARPPVTVRHRMRVPEVIG
jgi:hypothetical protein